MITSVGFYGSVARGRWGVFAQTAAAAAATAAVAKAAPALAAAAGRPEWCCPRPFVRPLASFSAPADTWIPSDLTPS